MKELELRVSRAEFSAMMAARANSAKYTFGDLSDASIDTVVSAMFAALRGMATQRIATEHPIPYTTYKIVVVEPASILDEIERVKEPDAKPLARQLVAFVQRGLGMVSRGEIDHQSFAIAMMREFEGRFGWTLESEQPPRAVALRSLVEKHTDEFWKRLERNAGPQHRPSCMDVSCRGCGRSE